MSRTKKTTGSKSPISKYIKFGGGEGIFTYWDKASSSKVEVNELELILLDVKNSISGYSEKHGTGLSSNMITSLGREEMKVTVYKNGSPTIIAEGLYKEIKPDISAVGGKLTTNLIALADIDGEGNLEVVNVQLAGAALGAWIDFKNDLKGGVTEYDKILSLKTGSLHKRGDEGNVLVTAKEEKDLDAKLKKNPRAPQPVWFYVPNVETTVALTDKQGELADEYDAELQEYFDGFTATKKVEAMEVVGAEDVSGDDDGDDLPF